MQIYYIDINCFFKMLNKTREHVPDIVHFPLDLTGIIF